MEEHPEILIQIQPLQLENSTVIQLKLTKKSSGKIITGSGDRRSFTTVAGLQYVKINKSRADIYNGKTTTIKLTGTTARPTWKSSNTKIATVSSKGVVTGKKAGTVNITATLCGRKFTCKVTVKNSSLSNTALKNNYTKFKIILINMV